MVKIKRLNLSGIKHAAKSCKFFDKCCKYNFKVKDLFKSTNIVGNIPQYKCHQFLQYFIKTGFNPSLQSFISRSTDEKETVKPHILVI